MSTRSKYIGGQQQFFDDQQAFELVHIHAPIQYRDDFLGAGSLVIPAAGSAENGVDWVKKIVGAGPPTVAGVANAAGGQIACTLTATSEKQDAAIYHGDQKTLDVTKGLIFEARPALGAAVGRRRPGGGASPPSGSTVRTTPRYLQFGATANGALLIRSFDGTTTKSIASGVTLLTTDWHDLSDRRDRRHRRQVFHRRRAGHGDRRCPFAATGTNAILQPYAAMYKPSGTGVGTLTVDDVKAWAKRV
jgi:hypothetical protein